MFNYARAQRYQPCTRGTDKSHLQVVFCQSSMCTLQITSDSKRYHMHPGSGAFVDRKPQQLNGYRQEVSFPFKGSHCLHSELLVLLTRATAPAVASSGQSRLVTPVFSHSQFYSLFMFLFTQYTHRTIHPQHAYNLIQSSLESTE